MSMIFETHIASNQTNAFQNKCDVFSKQCAVLLGFFVPVSTFVTQLLLLLLVISWFLAGDLKEKAAFIVKHPVSRMALLFFGVFIVGALYSHASSADSMSMLHKISKLLYLPFLLPVMQEQKWRRATMLAFLSAMLLTVILSVLRTYTGLSFVINPRFSGTAIFKDSIFTNLMMAFASFMTGHLFLNQKDFLKRIGLGVLLVSLIFYVLFMSAGRSGYVVFSVLWLLFAAQRLSLKGVIVGFLGLAILLSVTYFHSAVFQTRWLSVVSDFNRYTAGDSDNSIGERLEFLKNTWQLSKEQLWFGHGTGSFKEIYRNHSAQNHLVRTRNPHNEYINILFQLGLFGLIALIGFFVFLFKWSFALPRLEKWIGQGIILAIAIGCLANSWLMDFTSGYLFIVVLACCFGALTFKKDFQRE